MARGREKNGRFAPGNDITPPVRHVLTGGRPPDIAKQMLKAVAEYAYTPSQISRMIQATYDKAEEQGDWKGMYAVVALVLSYSIGKPVQRSVTAQIDPEDIKRMFAPEEEGEVGYVEVDDDSGAFSPDGDEL